MLMLAIILSFCFGYGFIHFYNLSGTRFKVRSREEEEKKGSALLGVFQSRLRSSEARRA